MNIPHNVRRGLTLIELSISFAILLSGMLAIIGVYTTGFSYYKETRIDLTARDTARSVLIDPRIMHDLEDGQSITSHGANSGGYINTFYAKYIVNGSSSLNGGTKINATVEIYDGGDDNTGRLVYSLTKDKFVIADLGSL